MRSIRFFALVVGSALALGGCGGGNAVLTPERPTGAASASPSPTPTPTVAPVANATTTVSLAGGAALSSSPLTVTAAPASGQSQTIDVASATLATGTTISLASGPTAVATNAVARAAAAKRTAFAVRSRPATFALPAFSGGAATFYDVATPSAPITAGGEISASFSGIGLINGGTYYLGFYDPTSASPAWQTISGPSTASGGAVTFSGAITSITFQAGVSYGFVIFTAAAAPPASPQTLVYYGDHSTVTIATETGTVVNTLAIPAQTFDLDDRGNIYAENSPAGSDQQTTPATVESYAAGTTTVTGVYTPSIADTPFIATSGAGELVAAHIYSDTNGTFVVDVWDPGVRGAPSRTITLTSYQPAFAVLHDGTIYLGATTPSGQPQFEVFAPGSTTPERTITDSLVPSSQWKNFSANYIAVGADGTLYVTEFTGVQPDALAGTYVYPPSGAERYIPAATNANGPGPLGVDVDALGNVYVVNNNHSLIASGNGYTCQPDTLQSITEYSPSGVLENTIALPYGYAIPITVAADGTAFASSFTFNLGDSSCQALGMGEIYDAAPGATTASLFPSPGGGSSELVLYDGTHKTTAFGSHGGVASGSRSSAALRRRLEQRI